VKWKKEYVVDMSEAKRLNHEEGFTMPELSEKFGIPKTTLMRYFHQANIPIYFNNHNGLTTRWIIRRKKENFKCVNAWKRALIERFGHKCMVCGYQTIVEAHHILPLHDGGKTSIDNGVLLCPNHHAEAHAGLFDLIALSKSGELLGKQEIAYQQPSRKSIKKWLRKTSLRVTEGSETRARAEAVMAPRAPDGLSAEDIVRTADINK